jgi:hypothetical protein
MRSITSACNFTDHTKAAVADATEALLEVQQVARNCRSVFAEPRDGKPEWPKFRA